MLLLEHDAKTLLAAAGVHIPPGLLLAPATDAALPPGPWVVKAQVPAGGRGKAGAIRPADSIEEVRAAAAALTAMTLKGHAVRACRVEQRVRGHEAYASLAIDPAAAGVRLLFSAHGGAEIEALHAADRVVRDALVAPDPEAAIHGFETLIAAAAPPPLGPPLRVAAARLAAAFFRYEAKLIEINPLFLAEDGGWVAGDAKMILDPNAIPRQPAIEALIRDRREAYPDAFLKLETGFDYIEIDPDGEIGLLTTGAGLSMMLIDELTARGLRPFNFCDIRTGQLRGDPRRLVQALSWIAAGPRVRAVLVNIFAGITDLGEFARLLVAAMRAVPALGVPVVARIIGNGFDAACRIIAAADLALRVEPDLDRAIAAAAAPETLR